MTTWGCQAGYLVLRPVGALSRLKSKKKNWYVLDEDKGVLAYYKNEDDAKNQAPLGVINVQNAAVSLALDQSNQFIIHSGGKEYLLTAENHESMMIWVLALQAKRDQWNNEEHEVFSDSDVTTDRNRPKVKRLESCSSEQDVTSKLRKMKNVEKKPKVNRTHSLQLDLQNKVTVPSHPTLTRMRSFWIGSPNSVTADKESTKDQNKLCVITDDNNNSGKKHKDTSNESTSDIEFNEKVSKEKVHLLRRLNSDQGKVDEIGKDRASSLSGTSISSDSAVGHSDSAQSCRLQDLESELIATKCELAKAMNRESSYKITIEERDFIVSDLDNRLKALEEQEDCGKNILEKDSSKLQEKCRILQNHNRFLNEEVLKLSKMHHQEQRRNQIHQFHIQELNEIIDKFKRDYVFLLMSSLRITCCDGSDIVYTYGNSMHKDRVLQLLEEARKINPSLPSYQSICKPQYYVDSLGFRRSYHNGNCSLHYICRQLYLHYCTQLPSYGQHLAAWKLYLKKHTGDLLRTKQLKSLVRAGIPSHLRSRVWCCLFKAKIRDIMEEKGAHYYNNLCSLAPESELVAQHKRQIALDLLRTMPDNVRFCDQNADGVRKMQEVLQAFCLHNPNLGYCQGMNFLTGMCLLFLEPEDAFWCLVAITEKYFTANYFDQNLIGAQADQEVLKDLLGEKLPNLHRHLSELDIELCTITLNWFLAIFFDCVPFETLLRIWDCFLLEGPKVLFRFALAILKLQQEFILSKPDTVSVMRQLKSAAKLLFDVDSLITTAFDQLLPFSRRQDISIKQACYYKALKEQSKKKEYEKAILKKREMLFSEEVFGSQELIIECGAVYDKDKLWLCHGHQTGAQLSKVNTDENIMYRLNIELEFRVMCMHALGDDVMLLGTISHFVFAYSTRSRKLLWEIRLNDSVLGLTSHQEDGVQQVYAGLADGTVAVIENIQGIQPKPDAFYIMIGSSPVTCLQLLEKRLWCACGNRVVILSARTLDTADQFQTSSNSLDYISMLVSGEQGMWIALKGSSVLQLWDIRTLTCRLLFDVRDNRYPRSPRMDDDIQINPSRVTAMLPFNGTVLIGTGEGSLIIYDVISRIPSRSSIDDTSCPRSIAKSPDANQIQEKIQELLEQDQSDNRHRNDSGCYTTPTPTPLFIQSRRESCLTTEYLPATTENEREWELQSPLGDNNSETTSCSTVTCRNGTGTKESLCLEEKDQQTIKTRMINTAESSCNSFELQFKKSLRYKKYFSLLELGKTKSLEKLVCTRSTDDVRRWTSMDNLSSSITSDSYEFDDLFVTYTEDELCRYSRKFSRLLGSSDAEALLQSLRKNSLSLGFQTSKETNSKFRGKIRPQLPSWYKDGLVTLSSDGESATGVEISEDRKLDCVSVASYEEVTRQKVRNLGQKHQDLLQLCEWNINNQKGSDSASNISFSSTDMPYILELIIQEKIKISDKPIKCLLETRVNNEPIIISCAGCYGDDEAVLKWIKESDNLWINDPIIEVCPYTNAIKPSPYVRSRMPRKSSGAATLSQDDDRTSKSILSSTSNANSMFGNSLAKVQNILARVHEKT